MAKLKLKLNRQEQEPIFESDEAIVRRAKAKMDADACVVQSAYRIANFQKAAQLLEQAEDYPGARKLLEECRAKEAQAEALKRSADYTHAKRHLEQAESEHEYERAAEELAPLAGAGYQDAKGLLEQAQRQAARLHWRVNIRRGVVLVLLAVLVCGGVTLWRGGYAHYIAAKLEGMGGIYESAYSRFYKLGDFLDSKEQYAYYKEKYLRQREKAEAKTLPDAAVGDSVDFSGLTWLVLEKDGTQLLLFCPNPGEESGFRGVAYDGATWAESGLRKALNSTVLKEEFTPAEEAALVPMRTQPQDNPKYGTDGGDAAEDLIRILAAGETTAWPEVFTSPSVDMWLCTPGHDGSAAAYMTAKGTVLLYGNDVEDDSLSACPLITVDYEKLEG